VPADNLAYLIGVMTVFTVFGVVLAYVAHIAARRPLG